MKKLTIEEIREPFRGGNHPPIMRADEAAELLRVPLKTIYCWVATGRLNGTFTRQGKRLLFWRERLIKSIFNKDQ